jgi:hypothetical protein
MSAFQIVLGILCLIGFFTWAFIAVARWYHTGVLGSCGCALVALSSLGFFNHWDRQFFQFLGPELVMLGGVAVTGIAAATECAKNWFELQNDEAAKRYEGPTRGKNE